MSFASGFYGRVADNMQDKKAFIRERVEEDRLYLRQQGLQRQAAVTEQKTRYQRATEQLMRINGVDRNRVLAALEADPDGVLDLAGRDLIKGSEINSVLELYEGTEASGNLSSILDRVMPGFAALPADADPTTVRRSSVASWLGLDTETELDKQVYGAQIVGGMTGDQILASMNIPLTATGTGSRGMNYDSIADPLTAAQKQSHFNDIVPEYDAMLEARISEVQQDEDMSPADKMDRLKELRALSEGSVGARLPGLLEEFGPTANSRAFFDELGTDLFGPGMSRFFEAVEVSPDVEAQTDEIITTELPTVLEFEDEGDIQDLVTNYAEQHPDADTVTLKGPGGEIREVPIDRSVDVSSIIGTPGERRTTPEEVDSLANRVVDFFEQGPEPLAPATAQSMRQEGQRPTDQDAGQWGDEVLIPLLRTAFDKDGNVINRWGEETLRPLLERAFDKDGNTMNRWGEEVLRPAIKRLLGGDE